MVFWSVQMIDVTTTMSILDQLIPTFGSLQAALLVVLCVVVTMLWRRPARNLPPGPRGLPIVGNTLSLLKGTPATLFTEWSKRYGDVFTYHLGPARRIVLNGYSVIHEALVKNAGDFSSRVPGYTNISSNGLGSGIASAPYGPKWKEHRKFALMSLRDFGVGKRSMEGKILEEARALGDEICKEGSNAFCISYMMQNTVTNVLCSIVFGCRYEYDDMEFKDLLSAINTFFSIRKVPRFVFIFRPMRYVPGLRKFYREHLQTDAIIIDHLKNRIREHEESFDPNNIRDFTDAFLLESRRTDGNSTFTEQQLIRIVSEMLLAGSETTTSALRWAVLYMILHPDIQDKVQQEIDSVLGSNQEPSMAHRGQMPYTVATLTEVSRLASVTPFALPHATSNDRTFRGYHIPKGTTVMVNLWSVHHDPQLWPEPSKFDPARFLDDNGNFVKRNEVIPFSIGRRSCLGKQLARMEIFLIFTSLLQRFTFKLLQGSPKPSEKGVIGPTHAPVPFKLVAEPRN